MRFIYTGFPRPVGFKRETVIHVFEIEIRLFVTARGQYSSNCGCRTQPKHRSQIADLQTIFVKMTRSALGEPAQDRDRPSAFSLARDKWRHGACPQSASFEYSACTDAHLTVAKTRTQEWRHRRRQRALFLACFRRIEDGLIEGAHDCH